MFLLRNALYRTISNYHSILYIQNGMPMASKYLPKRYIALHMKLKKRFTDQPDDLKLKTVTHLKRHEVLFLFDMDGTITLPRATIDPEMEEFLYTQVKPKVTIGIVGGSDLGKILQQMNGTIVLKNYDFIFPENGLVQMENGVEVGKEDIVHHLSEEKLQRFINFVLHYIADLKLPIKRGTFIEFRNAMINITPMGQQVTIEERRIFIEYDKKHQVRKKMIKILREKFQDLDLHFNVGGQISFDVFPRGWDKSYSLRYIEEHHNFKEIHFFGDKTEPGGNDYEIYNDPRVIGHKVEDPDHCREVVSKLLNITNEIEKDTL